MKNILYKPKVIIGIVFFIIIVIGVSIISAKNTKSRKLSEQLDLGARYLSEMDYDNAIVAYNIAIEIAPKSVEAYMGLADVYLAKGDYDKTLDILQRGYTQTKAEKISGKISEVKRLMEEIKVSQKEGKRLAEQKLSERTMNVWIDFPWQLTDFRNMGFNVFDSSWEDAKMEFCGEETWKKICMHIII